MSGKKEWLPPAIVLGGLVLLLVLVVRELEPSPFLPLIFLVGVMAIAIVVSMMIARRTKSRRPLPPWLTGKSVDPYY